MASRNLRGRFKTQLVWTPRSCSFRSDSASLPRSSHPNCSSSSSNMATNDLTNLESRNAYIQLVSTTLQTSSLLLLDREKDIFQIYVQANPQSAEQSFWIELNRRVEQLKPMLLADHHFGALTEEELLAGRKSSPTWFGRT